jgi:alkylation response protein AidB-like acyl-CoA dehydrogenase
MTDDTEEVESFRARAREWIRANLEPLPPTAAHGFGRRDAADEAELAAVAHDREVQRKLFDAGYAGICIPREYGGQGLSAAHQRAFNEELSGHEYAGRLQVPNFSPCAAVILEFGTEDQKRRHIPAMLRGEEIWMQFLSEPSGGSDVAAALTTAVRDGDEWVLNGSKVWTSGAWWSDWALCLARTNWDVPKHRGLTVFMMPIHQDGVEVQRIEMLNGSKEFCQEFMSDVRVPDTDRVGEIDQGWTVGTRWMFHERMQYNSPLVTAPATRAQGGVGAGALVDVARDAGRLDDPLVRDLIGEAHALDVASRELQRRVRDGITSRRMSDQAAAVARLLSCVTSGRLRTIAFDIAGPLGAAWDDDDGAAGECGLAFLMRQGGSIGGGTVEMARNVVSERVLGMPRERTLDREVPFREVPRSRPART